MALLRQGVDKEHHISGAVGFHLSNSTANSAHNYLLLVSRQNPSSASFKRTWGCCSNATQTFWKPSLHNGNLRLPHLRAIDHPNYSVSGFSNDIHWCGNVWWIRLKQAQNGWKFTGQIKDERKGNSLGLSHSISNMYMAILYAIWISSANSEECYSI